jgi:HlyD family secretion protein
LDFAVKKKIFVILILLILIGIGLYFYYAERPKRNEGELILFGNVDIRQVDLGFRVFGRVQTLFFDEGDFIKQGQLMAVLENTPYVEQVNQAKAAVLAAEANLEDAEVKLKRRVGLPPKIVSEEAYQDALFTRNSLQGTLKQAQATLASNLTNLQDTQMFCPTDGWILTRIREPGSVLNVGDPVFTLSVEAPVWIRAYISEPNLGDIYFGMPAEVTTDTQSMPVYQGRIGFISPVAEFTPKTVETTDLRTDLVYRLRIIIDKPDKWLRQGMPVTVKLRPDATIRSRS